MNMNTETDKEWLLDIVNNKKRVVKSFITLFWMKSDVKFELVYWEIKYRIKIEYYDDNFFKINWKTLTFNNITDMRYKISKDVVWRDFLEKLFAKINNESNKSLDKLKAKTILNWTITLSSTKKYSM